MVPYVGFLTFFLAYVVDAGCTRQKAIATNTAKASFPHFEPFIVAVRRALDMILRPPQMQSLFQVCRGRNAGANPRPRQPIPSPSTTATSALAPGVAESESVEAASASGFHLAVVDGPCDGE